MQTSSYTWRCTEAGCMEKKTNMTKHLLVAISCVKGCETQWHALKSSFVAQLQLTSSCTTGVNAEFCGGCKCGSIAAATTTWEASSALEAQQPSARVLSPCTLQLLDHPMVQQLKKQTHVIPYFCCLLMENNVLALKTKVLFYSLLAPMQQVPPVSLRGSSGQQRNKPRSWSGLFTLQVPKSSWKTEGHENALFSPRSEIKCHSSLSETTK